VSYYRDVIRATGVSEAMASHRLAQFEVLRQSHLAHHPAPRVLEVGAGRGDYAGLLARVFPHVACTEHAPEAARQARSLGIEVYQTHPDLETFPSDVGGAPYDLICCFSYLEHLPRPVDALAKLKAVAHADTLFLIEVPDSQFIFRKGLLNELIPDHLCYFTGTTLIKTLERAGLEVLSLQTSWEGYILSALCQPAQTDVVPAMLARYEAFRQTVENMLEAHAPTDTVVVWGAGHQALFTIATTALRERVAYIVDSAPFKQNMRAPGSGVPIHAPSQLLQDPPDLIIVACAGYNGEVLKALRRMNLTSPDVYVLSGLSLERAS
jgi:hypothetical protein